MSAKLCPLLAFDRFGSPRKCWGEDCRLWWFCRGPMEEEEEEMVLQPPPRLTRRALLECMRFMEENDIPITIDGERCYLRDSGPTDERYNPDEVANYCRSYGRGQLECVSDE